ncbi:MAG: hypothetical protein DRQ41_08440 [Gammaproteobacteria bacterium]|nr:MAG: hypothetical protein DRQ41_08440 [Gammaproteobacteria bacterium]
MIMKKKGNRMMVKSECVTIISVRLGMSKSEVQKVVEVFLTQIGNHLSKGNSVLLTGFGKFDMCGLNVHSRVG